MRYIKGDKNQRDAGSCARARSVSSGFTLIELLVVIAIIAILAAILFPIFAQAKKQAQISACQSSLKQLGLGIKMYADDNGGTLMRYENRRPMPNRLMWFNFINPYLKEDKIYRCPCLPDAKTTAANVPEQNRTYGYGLNINLCRSADPPSIPLPANKTFIKIDSVERPAATLMLCDAYTLEARNGAYVEVGFPVAYGVNNNQGNKLPYLLDGNVGSRTRHGGRVSVLYVDGHVRTLPYAYVNQPYQTLAQSKNDDIWGDFDTYLNPR